jgi:hypothetical protein
MENPAAPHPNNSSGVRGVCWVSQKKKWRATIGHNQRQVHVGYFSDLADAESAVVAKRNKLFTHNDADRR